jgi:hypothetical protein
VLAVVLTQALLKNRQIILQQDILAASGIVFQPLSYQSHAGGDSGSNNDNSNNND